MTKPQACQSVESNKVNEQLEMFCPVKSEVNVSGAKEAILVAWASGQRALVRRQNAGQGWNVGISTRGRQERKPSGERPEHS